MGVAYWPGNCYSLKAYCMEANYMREERRETLVAFLLCVFLGYLGIHRFYQWKFITGIVWLLTGGLFGVGWVIDSILLGVDLFSGRDE